MKRAPFVPTVLEGERVSTDNVVIRLNIEERQYLEALKLYHNIKNDSTALKREAFKVFKQQAFLNEIKAK